MTRDCKANGHIWTVERHTDGRARTFCWSCGVDRKVIDPNPNSYGAELSYLEGRLTTAAYSGASRVEVDVWELARVVGKLRELLKGDA